MKFVSESVENNLEKGEKSGPISAMILIGLQKLSHFRQFLTLPPFGTPRPMQRIKHRMAFSLPRLIGRFILHMYGIAPPGWLSGERVGLMTWWLRVRSPVEATFLSGVFSPLTSAEACEKGSRWLWKESCVSTGVRKPGNTYASPTAMI